MKEINDLKLLLHSFVKGKTCKIVESSNLFSDIIKRNFLEGVFCVSCPNSHDRKLFENKHREYFIQYFSITNEIKRLKKTKLKFELLKGANMLHFYKPGTRQFRDLDVLMDKFEIIKLYKNSSFKFFGEKDNLNEDFNTRLGLCLIYSYVYEFKFLDLKTNVFVEAHSDLYASTTIFRSLLRQHFKEHKKEATFLHFAIHSTNMHRMEFIITNLLDAAFLIPKIDWNILIKFSKETNSTSFLFIFLKFLECLDFYVPKQVFLKLKNYSKKYQLIVFLLINMINKKRVILRGRSLIIRLIYKLYYEIGPLYHITIFLHKIVSLFSFKKLT